MKGRAKLFEQTDDEKARRTHVLLGFERSSLSTRSQDTSLEQNLGNTCVVGFVHGDMARLVNLPT